MEEAILKLIYLSYDYRTRGNISQVNLLKESKYPELSNQISEEIIIEVLKQHSHLINEWLLFSENKRTGDRVWTFSKFDDGEYSVAYSYQRDESEEINTKDGLAACAAFIKREAEAIKKYI